VSSGSIIVPGGGTNIIAITTCANVPGEQAQFLVVSLTGATSGTIVDGQGIGTIAETPGGGDIAINDLSCAAGNACNFTVTRAGGIGPVNVVWSTANGTALGTGACPATPSATQDYVVAAGIVPVGANATANIAIATCTNAAAEVAETFNVNLNSASSGTITDPTGVGTINP